jgi:hypothetical protein
LAAPESAPQQIVDQKAGFVAGQVREKFSLHPACQIGARLGCGNVELRKIVLVFCHGHQTGSESKSILE